MTWHIVQNCWCPLQCLTFYTHEKEWDVIVIIPLGFNKRYMLCLKEKIMKVWNLYLLRVIDMLVIVNGQTVLHRIRKLPLPFVSKLVLSYLVQFSKTPRGISIYYFPLISGRPRRSAMQLITQVKLLPRVWDEDLSVLYCTSGAWGLFFSQRLQRAFCLMIQRLGLLESCI